MNIDNDLFEINSMIGKIKIKKHVISTLITTTFVVISSISIYQSASDNNFIPLSITLTSSYVSSGVLKGLSNYFLDKDLDELESYKNEYEIKKQLIKRK